MAAILIFMGYLKCNDGTFECTPQKFPYVSKIMGLAPQNKLYAIMLTFYAFVKQFNIRAQYCHLEGIASQNL